MDRIYSELHEVCRSKTVARAVGRQDPTPSTKWQKTIHTNYKYTFSRVTVRGSVVGKQSKEQWEWGSDWASLTTRLLSQWDPYDRTLTDTSVMIGTKKREKKVTRRLLMLIWIPRCILHPAWFFCMLFTLWCAPFCEVFHVSRAPNSAMFITLSNQHFLFYYFHLTTPLNFGNHLKLICSFYNIYDLGYSLNPHLGV